MTPPTKPPTDDRYRLYRGGSWDDSSAYDVRAVVPYGTTPTVRYLNLGFRCAQRGCRQKGVTSP